MVSPNWIGDTLVFASDQGATFPDHADGQANLWALDALGSGEPKQITHHGTAEGYVRDPASDGERIVYHARGVLYLLTALDAAPTALDVTLGGALATRRSRALAPTERLNEVRPDQGGDSSVVEWRGKVFQLAHREGPARAVVADSGVRARLPRLLGRSGSAIVVSDAAGADRLEIHDLSGATAVRIVDADVGRVVGLEASPTGDVAIALSRDGRVHRVDVASAQTREVARSDEGEVASVAFSPDGRYVVWAQPTRLEQLHQLVGLDLSRDDAEPVTLTSGRFADTSPSFSRDGKHLLFLSARTFDPSYDQHSFDMSFVAAVRPYLVPLTATEAAPFGPSAEGWRISAPDAPAADGPPSGTTAEGSGEGAAAVTCPDWDVEGFEERIVAFPVPSAGYRELRAAHDGVLWIHESAERGVLGTSRAGVTDEPADLLEYFSFPKRKLEVLGKADGYAPSGDGRRVVVREKEALSVRPADRAVKPDDADHVAIDVGRLHFELDPVAEWRQMFEETVRLMTDNFWRADMDGVDWAGVVDLYRPLLERIASYDDLVDVLWEVIGELNTSHAYVMPPVEAGDLSRRLGKLGADLSPADGGWRIDRILPGESSDPEARSPLRAAGVGANEGDVVVAVGGRAVDPRFGPAASLLGVADQPVELTIRAGDAAGSDSDRRVVVVPLATEETLRYQDWVRGRAAYVAEHGGGRLGYVHIPDMMGVGWAQLFRSLRQATQREGLIVDVRYNRGGHTSQLVIEQLARRPIGWAVARGVGSFETYPDNSPRGPVVFVTNENAGSDGDIVNAAAQALGIGPVVGVRTWGGVVGIDGRFDLVDGTVVTQPRFAFWLKGKEWGVENHGVDPDIEVEIAPAELLHEAESDRQLDRAIEEALTRLEAQPAAGPPPMPPPKVRPTA